MESLEHKQSMSRPQTWCKDQPLSQPTPLVTIGTRPLQTGEILLKRRDVSCSFNSTPCVSPGASPGPLTPPRWGQVTYYHSPIPEVPMTTLKSFQMGPSSKGSLRTAQMRIRIQASHTQGSLWKVKRCRKAGRELRSTSNLRPR